VDVEALVKVELIIIAKAAATAAATTAEKTRTYALTN
jgi:hypothetical protein